MSDTRDALQVLVDIEAEAEQEYRAAMPSQKIRLLEKWAKVAGAITLLGEKGVDIADLRQIVAGK